MPFFELEELLDCLKELAEKEEEERKKKEGKQGTSIPNMNSYMRQIGNMSSNSGVNLPMPNMPNFNL